MESNPSLAFTGGPRGRDGLALLSDVMKMLDKDLVDVKYFLSGVASLLSYRLDTMRIAVNLAGAEGRKAAWRARGGMAKYWQLPCNCETNQVCGRRENERSIDDLIRNVPATKRPWWSGTELRNLSLRESNSSAHSYQSSGYGTYRSRKSEDCAMARADRTNSVL